MPQLLSVLLYVVLLRFGFLGLASMQKLAPRTSKAATLCAFPGTATCAKKQNWKLVASWCLVLREWCCLSSSCFAPIPVYMYTNRHIEKLGNMHICIYICSGVHKHMYIIYIYTYKYISTYSPLQICTYTNTYAKTHVLKYALPIYTYTHTIICIYKYAYMSIYIYRYVQIHVYTDIYIYMHTHIQIQIHIMLLHLHIHIYMQIYTCTYTYTITYTITLA